MATTVAPPAASPSDIQLTPVATTVRKSYGELSVSSSVVIGISVMAQLFTDRVWLCINEVNAADPEGDRMRPGTIIVGTPAPLVAGAGAGAAGGAAADYCLSSPDEMEVVMGDRDDPLTNVLSTHVFNLIAEAAPGKGMCLCLSTRRLTRSLGTPEARRAAIDSIMALVVDALDLE